MLQTQTQSIALQEPKKAKKFVTQKKNECELNSAPSIYFKLIN